MTTVVESGTCNACNHAIRLERTPYNRDWRCNEAHPPCTMIGCVPVREASRG